MEHVLAAPDFAMPATKEEYTLLVRRNGEDKVTVVEFELRGGKYRVAVRHMFKEHGDVAKERSRGQLAITPDDLAAIPEIIGSRDKTIYGAKNRQGRDLIGYLKKLPDGKTLYFEEVRTGRKTVAGASMRKYPATMDAQAIIASVNLNVRGDGGTLRIIDHPDKTGEGQASGGLVKGPQAPLYSVAPADATLPGILQPSNVPRVLDWFSPKLDAVRVKVQGRFLMLRHHQEAVETCSGRHQRCIRVGDSAERKRFHLAQLRPVGKAAR